MMTTTIKDRPPNAKAAKSKPAKRTPTKRARKKPTKAKAIPKIETGRDITFLPVSDLHVSELNMRHGQTDPDIDDIYPSILEGGVNQSLLVRKEGKGYGVIAGRRRLFALRRAEAETGRSLTAPCLIETSGNEAEARKASLLENVARLPATDLEQFAAFKALAEADQTPARIAASFGLTEKRVKRVLALAHIHPDILKLYEDEEINAETLRHMTMATSEQQAAWLDIWKGENYAPQNGYLKEWLTGGTPISTKVALFDMDEYDGHIITDLFGDQGYFQDADLFWEHQNRAIARAVEEYRADGWTGVVLLDRGKHFARYEHGKRAKEAGGRVYLEIGHDGSVEPYQGYLPHADIKKIDKILGTGTAANDTKSTPSDRPEMSGPLAEYVRLHRHGAAQVSLLDAPRIALRLTVAHMLAGSHLWTCEPASTRSRKESTTKSVAASPNAKRMAEEAEAVLTNLGLTRCSGYNARPTTIVLEGFTETFAALLKADDALAMRALTLAMALTLTTDEPIVEALIAVLQPDMNALWEPDDAFFDILRDKRVINAILGEIGGKRLASSLISETGTKQKAALRNRFTGQGVGPDVARPDWRPRWMRTKPTAYLDVKTCPPAEATKEVAGRMQTGGKETAA